jgi:hypothetical protein
MTQERQKSTATKVGVKALSTSVALLLAALTLGLLFVGSAMAIPCDPFEKPECNHAPTVTVSSKTVNVLGGETAHNSGTYNDVDGERWADLVVVSASVGEITYEGGYSGNWSWSYTPEDSPATTTVTITAEDTYGGVNENTFTLNVSDRVDLEEPVVSVISPTGNNVSQRANVTATFSEDMKADTITTGTFTLTRRGASQPVGATVSYYALSKKAILNPSRDLRAGATYVAKVVGGSSGVQDLAGNPLAANKVWSFRVR